MRTFTERHEAPIHSASQPSAQREMTQPEEMHCPVTLTTRSRQTSPTAH